MAILYMPSIATEGLSSWIRVAAIGAIVMVIVRLQLLRFILQFVRESVWMQWKVAKRMRELGHSGPSFSLFTTNRQEMAELTMKAPTDPLYSSSGLSHDIIPRVFAPFLTWTHRYGDKFIFKSPTRSRVTMYTTDAEAIKEIFSNNFLEYGKPIMSNFFQIFGTNGLLLAEREEWARQRKVVRPAFYPARSKNMVDQVASWIELWRQKLENSVANNGGSLEIDMFVAFGDLVKDILARSSFGSSFEKGKKGFQHQEKHRYLLYRQQTISNPLLRWIGGPTSLKKAISEEKGELLKCLIEIIQERRKSIQPGNIESYGDDLLGLLLADRDRRLAEHGRPAGELETEDTHLTDQCRTFFFAGAETVNIALSWATVLLGHYIDWQQRIRAEVQEVFRDALPNGDQLMKLKQLDMSVQETLRLYSPAPVTYREVVGDHTSLLGEPLPKHLAIMINFLGVHREKEYWGDDALQFEPERFSNGIRQACPKPYAFDAFGVGPRTCVAQSFALMEVKLVLAMLLQRFSFRLSPSYRHEPMLMMVLIPKFGVQVVMESIRPASSD